MQTLRKNIPLLILLIAGLAVRLWNAGTMSLSNDELSALLRLKFGSLPELWREGVRIDGHPAFVQTFLYFWLKIFPATPFFIRLPGIIAGTCSIGLTYCIGKKWFSPATGLFAAACLAFSEYTVLYSQLARPYAFGLCFVLWMAWSWSRIVFSPPPYNRRLIAQAILATALCFYTHYFSFFQALLIGGTGFLLVRGAQRKTYFIAAAGAFLLFLPHLEITLHQMTIGGVGGWLGKPGYDFPLNFLLYMFNTSPVLCACVALLLCIACIQNMPEEKTALRRRIIALCWFFVPFLTGFYYSRQVNPVLQFSVLIFAYPFLLLFIFSFLTRMRERWIIPSFAAFSLLFFLHTFSLFGRNYYGRAHFGEYKELANDMIRWKKEYGDEIHEIVLVNHPYYFGYYLDRADIQTIDRFYRKIPNGFISFRKYLSQLDAPYLAYGFTNQYSAPEIPEMIGEYYPYRVEQKNYLNAGSYLFSKNPVPVAVPDTVHTLFHDFETEQAPWKSIASLQDSSISFSGKYSLHLSPATEFAASLEIPAKELVERSCNVLHIQTHIYSRDSLCNVQLVLSVERNGKSIFWTSREYRHQAIREGWNTFYLSQRMDMEGFRPVSDTLKIYLWNPGKNDLYADGLRIWVQEGNPVLYGY